VVNHGSPKAEPGVRFPPSLPKSKAMKRFFLYFLLVLFILGLAMLAYGFWNAKNIRLWAAKAEEIRMQHDIGGKEKDITSRFEDSGGKKMEDLKNELAGFSADLSAIQKETEEAKQETENLGAPKAAQPVRQELVDFYTQSGKQIQNLESVSKFMNQLFEIAIIFDGIKQDTKLEEIQVMIAQAKTKSSEISAGILPEEVKTSGNDLKTATDSFLDTIDQTAAGKVEGSDQLNAAYADFSQKENDFFNAAKKYINSFQNTDLIGQKIDTDLMVLRKVKFSVK
jgi:hypothetical protein